MFAADGNALRFRAASEPLLTAALHRADTNLVSAVPTTTHAQTAAEAVAFPRTLARTLTLPLIFVAATAYHFLQSRGHATTTVFNDELLYAKLSQSIAAGHGLAIRGEPFFFPAPLASLHISLISSALRKPLP